MACDLIENYRDQPVFQFIRDVGVDWEQTKVLNGEVGDFVTVAREERGTGDWFIGSISDENERSITIDFNFLDPDIDYKAVIYKDGKDAHYATNPTSIDIINEIINNKSSESYKLAAGGGLAISLQRMNR